MGRKEFFQLYENTPIVTAEFCGRDNRFVVECLIKGKAFKAHIPNPGRLWEILYPGTPLYLIATKKGKLSYRVIGAAPPQGLVMLDTVRSNLVGEFLLRTGRVPGLEEWRLARREVAMGKSRFDFLLERGEEKLFLELKTCTLFHRHGAMFPDAPTERGRKHLEELAHLAHQPHTRGGVLFLVQNNRSELFLPDYHTDPLFGEVLLHVKDTLWIQALGIGWKEDFCLEEKVSPLVLPWEVLEKENRDRGCYMVLYRLGEDKEITLGSLGTRLCRKGFYIYVGSAMKNLTSRISRHLRKRKQPRWHVDFFGAHAKALKALPIRTSRHLERTLAKKVRALASWEIPDLGASDSPLPSHMFGFEGNPLEREDFVTLLLEHRMEAMLDYPKNSKV